MNLKKVSKMLKKSQQNDFLTKINYLGAAIGSHVEGCASEYVDLEVFFVEALNYSHTSRSMEAFLCWCVEYGHLLSPSKVRRLIRQTKVNPQLVGGIVEFLVMHEIKTAQWKILRPFAKRGKHFNLFAGPRVRDPQPEFAIYGVLMPNFSLDSKKFLRPQSWTLKNCLELRNRALFGSVIHSDLASVIAKDSTINAYRAFKKINHDKSNVFKYFDEVKMAMLAG